MEGSGIHLNISKCSFVNNTTKDGEILYQLTTGDTDEVLVIDNLAKTSNFITIDNSLLKEKVLNITYSEITSSLALQKNTTDKENENLTLAGIWFIGCQ